MRRKLFLLTTLFFIGIGSMMAQTQVQGTVVDKSGEPVIGATVRLKGAQSTGTATDIDGKFSLTVPANAILIVSYVGMQTQEVKAAPNLSITLHSDSEMLQEVVVTGMTVTDKRLFTGAATKISAEDARLDGLADVSRALEGRAGSRKASTTRARILQPKPTKPWSLF